MSKLYDFSLVICGWGDTPEEAWESCKENFDIEKEELPSYEIVDEDE